MSDAIAAIGFLAIIAIIGRITFLLEDSHDILKELRERKP